MARRRRLCHTYRTTTAPLTELDAPPALPRPARALPAPLAHVQAVQVGEAADGVVQLLAAAAQHLAQLQLLQGPRPLQRANGAALAQAARPARGGGGGGGGRAWVAGAQAEPKGGRQRACGATRHARSVHDPQPAREHQVAHFGQHPAQCSHLSDRLVRRGSEATRARSCLDSCMCSSASSLAPGKVCCEGRKRVGCWVACSKIGQNCAKAAPWASGMQDGLQGPLVGSTH